MKMSIVLLTACLAVGCSFGPDHLPALYAQREVFQGHIDRVLEDMSRNENWWRSLPEERRRYWKDYLTRVRLEERDRALKNIEALNEGLDHLDGRNAR